MFTKLRRWFFTRMRRIGYWIGEHDLCEICHEEQVMNTCIGCERRICCMCDSGYYEDAELCTICRSQITPEEEAEDARLQAEFESVEVENEGKS